MFWLLFALCMVSVAICVGYAIFKMVIKKKESAD